VALVTNSRRAATPGAITSTIIAATTSDGRPLSASAPGTSTSDFAVQM
jgi:hypothetical protein